LTLIELQEYKIQTEYGNVECSAASSPSGPTRYDLSVAVKVSIVGVFPDLTVNNKTKPTNAPMSEMGSFRLF
jgi:hypothetical protein